MINKSIPGFDFLKKVIIQISVTFLLIFGFAGCNKKCDCTSEPCPCFPFTISVYANANNSAEGSFATKEMDEFYLYRTNENFTTIDSVKMTFTDIFSNIDYNKVYRFSKETFSNVPDIRPYNFIIKNLMVESADTISAISYSEDLQRLLCNVCTNCDDEYIDCVTYVDVNLELNCDIQNNAEIGILRIPNE